MKYPELWWQEYDSDFKTPFLGKEWGSVREFVFITKCYVSGCIVQLDTNQVALRKGQGKSTLYEMEDFRAVKINDNFTFGDVLDFDPDYLVTLQKQDFLVNVYGPDRPIHNLRPIKSENSMMARYIEQAVCDQNKELIVNVNQFIWKALHQWRPHKPILVFTTPTNTTKTSFGLLVSGLMHGFAVIDQQTFDPPTSPSVRFVKVYDPPLGKLDELKKLCERYHVVITTVKPEVFIEYKDHCVTISNTNTNNTLAFSLFLNQSTKKELLPKSGSECDKYFGHLTTWMAKESDAKYQIN
nr:hypothetical protein [Abalone asfa-like virus]